MIILFTREFEFPKGAEFSLCYPRIWNAAYLSTVVFFLIILNQVYLKAAKSCTGVGIVQLNLADLVLFSLKPKLSCFFLSLNFPEEV